MSYETYIAKAANIFESARTILNSNPNDRDIQRARLAINLGEAYGSLAETAARREDREQDAARRREQDAERRQEREDAKEKDAPRRTERGGPNPLAHPAG